MEGVFWHLVPGGAAGAAVSPWVRGAAALPAGVRSARCRFCGWHWREPPHAAF